jgi:hypothetical protein
MAEPRLVRWVRRLRGRLKRRRLPRRLDPLYRPQPDGTFILYTGGFVIDPGKGERVLDGQVEFRLAPRSTVVARFSGPWPEYEVVSAVGRSNGEPEFSFASAIDLTPPAGPRHQKRTGKESWSNSSYSSIPGRAGDLRKAKRFVAHISGPLKIRFPFSVPVKGGGHQPQVSFELPGWKLRLAPTIDEPSEGDFSAVVEATRTNRRPTQSDIDLLSRRLFHLLGLMANREIGIGPICGLDRADRVVWVDWRPPRVRFGKVGGWCPLDHSVEVLPLLAEKLSGIADDPALETIVDRAINQLQAADGSEVLDVRIPIAGSAVELLSWAVLQREEGLSPDDVEDMPTGEQARRALEWAGIPVGMPKHFTALEKRRNRIGQPGWKAPEVAFNVRNKLIHPPKRVQDPEWPTGDELYEAWLLITWYLELLLLRVIGYDGLYWPRLDLPRFVSDVELVPWAPAPQQGSGPTGVVRPKTSG